MLPNASVKHRNASVKHRNASEVTQRQVISPEGLKSSVEGGVHVTVGVALPRWLFRGPEWMDHTLIAPHHQVSDATELYWRRYKRNRPPLNPKP